MHWHDWNDHAFDRARERGSLVLLFLHASWCRWCREFEQEVLADPEIQKLLSEGFVCIRADKDRRPDIDSRYRHEGWPTLAVLDAEGVILRRTNNVNVEDFKKLLMTSDPALSAATGAESPSVDAPHEAPVQECELEDQFPALSMKLVGQITDSLVQSADSRYGGWGTRHKFPHPESLHFLLGRWAHTGDEQTLAVVVRTLRNMQAGEIYDRVEGGFYRYATQMDWSVPHHEKMLDSNAKRLLAYVEAYQALGEESFRETAEGILSWMTDTLLDPLTHAFKSSQDADSAYAHLSTREARELHGQPECDPTLFTNYNANAAVALFRSAAVLGRGALHEQAVSTIEFLLDEMWDEREGMYHYWDGTYNLPGMLTDQAAMLRALVEGVQYTGRNEWLEQARSIAHFTVEHLQASDGSFRDARHDPRSQAAASSRRGTSVLDNAVMAEVLLRLGHLTYEQGLVEKGREALQSLVGEYKRFGAQMGAYGRAVDLLMHPPVHVIVVGPQHADLTHSLRRAALRPYGVCRLVQSIDPVIDQELFARSGLPVPSAGQVARAYVDQGHASFAETSDPARLPALMVGVERSS